MSQRLLLTLDCINEPGQMLSNNKRLATVDYLKSDNSWEALLSVAEDSRFEVML